MSSQASDIFPAIPFSTTSPQQSLRLLELTPDLADLIESQRHISNKRRKLWFKSAGARPETWNGDDHLDDKTKQLEKEREGILHLCSDEKVWAVRQVSTSNSIHVARSVSGREGEKTKAGGGGDIAMVTGAADEGVAQPALNNSGITTISQVKTILELIETHPTQSEVEAAIRARVPIYVDNETEGDKYPAVNPPRIKLRQVLDDVVASDQALDTALKQLLVFGDKDPGRSRDGDEGEEQSQSVVPNMFIPSTNLLLKSWVIFTSSAKSMRVNLDSKTGVTYDQAKRVMCEVESVTEGDLVGNVVTAVLRRAILEGKEELETDSKGSYYVDFSDVEMTEDDYADIEDDDDEGDDDDGEEDEDGIDDGNETVKNTNENDTATGPRMTFDPALLRQIIGQSLLFSLVRDYSSLSDLKLEEDGSITVNDFSRGWKKLLPRSWRKECDVHTLVSHMSGWQVAKNEEGEEILRHAHEGGKVPDDSAKAPAKKKGKWHEKFGAQRNAALKK